MMKYYMVLFPVVFFALTAPSGCKKKKPAPSPVPEYITQCEKFYEKMRACMPFMLTISRNMNYSVAQEKEHFMKRCIKRKDKELQKAFMECSASSDQGDCDGFKRCHREVARRRILKGHEKMKKYYKNKKSALGLKPPVVWNMGKQGKEGSR